MSAPAEISASPDADDPRFTMGLYIAVLGVLKKHGYVEAADRRAHADVLLDLLHMVKHFEGVRS